jgi:hypothetical protein
MQIQSNDILTLYNYLPSDCKSKYVIQLRKTVTYSYNIILYDYTTSTLTYCSYGSNDCTRLF